MNAPEAPIGPLRMAPPESPEELAHRYVREQRVVLRQKEATLEESLAPYRVGSVPYLNVAPLVRGIEEQLIQAPPSQLAVMLQRGELDAALVSSAEVLLNDGYEVLDGIAVASLGEVKSVLLAHRVPLEEIREVHCDTASVSGRNLLKVLLAEHRLTPRLVQLPGYDQAAACEAVMLIGDEAIDFSRAGHPHAIWDLGAAWYELTGLPFVYAVWALRRGIDHARLRRRLREARDFGMDTLDYIISSRTEYDYDFRKDYLSWHIHYHLGDDEKRGLARFVELLRRHADGPVFPPRFVT